MAICDQKHYGCEIMIWTHGCEIVIWTHGCEIMIWTYECEIVIWTFGCETISPNQINTFSNLMSIGQLII
jgi:hypothetical protein